MNRYCQTFAATRNYNISTYDKEFLLKSVNKNVMHTI